MSGWNTRTVHVSAKSDYAIRALLALAACEPDYVKVEAIVGDQELPRKFVEAILSDLRRANIVRTMRGADGGYALARPASAVTLGQVIRAVDGPLAEVRGLRPNEATYRGVAEHLPEVWVALRAAMRRVLDETTLVARAEREAARARAQTHRRSRGLGAALRR